jgi:uncharacterized integral membrane protein (TIGR00698 family)
MSLSPRWIPKRKDGAGLALVAVLGIAAVLLTRALPRSPLVSEVLVAMLLGAVVLNTPLGRLVGLRAASDPRTARCGDEADRYGGGVAFACSWLLRLAIVLMGLKVQTSAIGGGDLLLVLAVCATAVPSTFFVAQILGTRLGLRGAFADLLAAGSMICGASAVNATAPIVGAEKQEQGMAVAIVFLSSVGAMLSFRALAHAVGLPSAEAGLWAGLSVNDLSSAVAVGTQMGGDGGVTAAAAKSTRILMLAPMLVALALLRSRNLPDPGEADASRAAADPAGDAAAAPSAAAPVPRRRFDAALRKSLMASLPSFILGYLALAFVRVAGDRAFGAAPGWLAFLDGNRVVVEVLMAMVSAGIGLSLAFGALLANGSRGIVASVTASAFMAALTLAMVTAAYRHGFTAASAIGVCALLATYVVYGRYGRREVPRLPAATITAGTAVRASRRPSSPPDRA